MGSRLTRSDLFARGGATLLLGGSAIGALAATAQASPPSGAFGAITASDLAYVRLLIGAELLLVNFYTEALASKHLTGGARDQAALALVNENEHYGYLSSIVAGVGGVPLTAADVNFTYPKASFYAARSVVELAVTLELLAVGAYLGAAGNLANPMLQAAVAQVTANETQHLSAFSVHLGKPLFHDAFPNALTIEEASDALGAYTS